MKNEAMSTFRYGFETTLSDTNYDDAVQRVTDELEKEGFGILTEIDVGATRKKKLDVDFRRYIILRACNPILAYDALGVEPQIEAFPATHRRSALARSTRAVSSDIRSAFRSGRCSTIPISSSPASSATVRRRRGRSQRRGIPASGSA